MAKNVSPVIRTLFDMTVDPGIDCTHDPVTGEVTPSLTVQADMPACDLNTIMAQYERSGLTGFEDRMASGAFVDLASMPTYREAQDIIAQANDAFASLPASLRKRFSNDPAEFLSFFDDPANLDEAVRLGLATLPEPPPLDPADSSSSTGSTSNDGE